LAETAASRREEWGVPPRYRGVPPAVRDRPAGVPGRSRRGGLERSAAVPGRSGRGGLGVPPRSRGRD